MANRKKRLILISILILVGIIVSACTKPYSTEPLEPPTANPTTLFVSPLPTSDNPMAMVEELSTGTALAETAVALTAGTPPATEAPVGTESPAAGDSTPDSGSTEAPVTDEVEPTAIQPLPTVITNRPASYTLQRGEFPYCIARRFNLDPAELLNLNGLASGDVYYPNLTLTIPQSGKPFPGTRALHSHPDVFTVDSSDRTVYGVACHYGDVDPAAIAQANNIQLTAILTVGQQLNIP